MATRFELRSPNPHSNTYLVVGASFMLMLDGIEAVLSNSKTPAELAVSISKKAGEKDFYLAKDREYRSELNVFECFTKREREKLFGKAPATVWENLKAFDTHEDELAKLTGGDETAKDVIMSYRAQMSMKWVMEFRDRILPNSMDFVRNCKKRHNELEATDYDIMNWRRVNSLRIALGKDSIDSKSILTLAREAIDSADFDAASRYELLIQEKIEELRGAYSTYIKNLF